MFAEAPDPYRNHGRLLRTPLSFPALEQERQLQVEVAQTQGLEHIRDARAALGA